MHKGYRTMKQGFTLIELLVVIAIIAAVSIVVVLTLNPSELLRQSRDGIRVSDLSALNTSLALFNAGQSNLPMGSTSVVYVSLNSASTTCADQGLAALSSPYSFTCAATSTLRYVDGTGWVPVDLTASSFGNPLPQLPIDPSNSTSTGLYYTYQRSPNSWEVTALMESVKYSHYMSEDGGLSTTTYETGPDLTLATSTVLSRGASSGSGGGGANPAPALSSISPTSTPAGSTTFTLTLIGSSFTTSSVVNWDGSALSTTYVSSTQLTASVPSTNVTSAGTHSLTVVTPTPGGGTSGAQTFTVVQYAPDVSWTTDSSSSTAQGAGAAIAEDGGKFYVLNGNGGTTFQMYDPSNRTWTTKAAAPLAVQNGAALVAYDSDTLYAFRGNNTASFWKYNIGANAWTVMASTTNTVYAGGALAYPGTGDTIYGFRGYNDDGFWAYSVANNSWGQSGVAQGAGASIVEDGGKLYTLDGAGTGFRMYDPSTRTWTAKASTPIAVNNGAALVTYDSDTLYAFSGNAGTSFWKYGITANAWTAMASTSATISAGGALAYPGTGDYIYALRGFNSTNAYKYSISGNSWSAISSTPVSIYQGGSLVAFDSDTLYALEGNNTTPFLQYKISTNTWTTKASSPVNVGGGGSLATDGTYIYALGGNFTTAFRKYDPSNDTWSSLASTSVAIGNGSGIALGGLAYSSTQRKLYAIPGGANTSYKNSILWYDPATGYWLSPASPPAAIYYGGALTAFDSDTLYAFGGSNDVPFYQYKISQGKWTAKTSAPQAVGGGGALASDGVYVYGLRGNAATTFWKYDPTGNSWSALASTTIAVGNAGGIAEGGMAYSSSLHGVYAIPGTGTSVMKNVFLAQ